VELALGMTAFTLVVGTLLTLYQAWIEEAWPGPRATMKAAASFIMLGASIGGMLSAYRWYEERQVRAGWKYPDCKNMGAPCTEHPGLRIIGQPYTTSATTPPWMPPADERPAYMGYEQD